MFMKFKKSMILMVLIPSNLLLLASEANKGYEQQLQRIHKAVNNLMHSNIG